MESMRQMERETDRQDREREGKHEKLTLREGDREKVKVKGRDLKKHNDSGILESSQIDRKPMSYAI